MVAPTSAATRTMPVTPAMREVMSAHFSDTEDDGRHVKQHADIRERIHGDGDQHARRYGKIMHRFGAQREQAEVREHIVERSHRRVRRATAEACRKLQEIDRKSTRLNSSHLGISYAVFCLKKKKKTQ